jgi:integrase
VEKTKRPKTLASYLYVLQPFVADRGTILIVDLAPKHVSEFLTKKPRWKSGTTRILVSALKAAMRWGVEQGYISRNPLMNLKRPASGIRDVSCVVTEEEHKLILSQAPLALADLLTALWTTGSRPSALIVAKARDLQGDQLVIVGRAGIKIKKVVIYLDPPTKELVTRLAESAGSGPIFRNAFGEPWTLAALQIGLKVITRRLGCKHVTPYSYRHAFAFRALARGVPIAVLAKLMNTSVAQIERHYGHLDTQTDTLRKALSMMAG